MSKKQNHEKPKIKPIPKPTEIEIFQAHTALGTGGKSELRHVLTCFEMKIWAMQENEEWEEEKFKQYLGAKFILTHKFIFHQIDNSPDHRFKTEGQIPFDEPCKHCSGLGQKFKFMRRTMKIKCMKCNGTGKNEDGTKCSTCRSKTLPPGIVQAFAIISQFRELTLCEKCHGLGYSTKKVKSAVNPVVDESTAAKLKMQLVQKEQPEAPTTIGDVIQASPPEVPPEETMLEVVEAPKPEDVVVKNEQPSE